jgi:hypothetical protein
MIVLDTSLSTLQDKLASQGIELKINPNGRYDITEERIQKATEVLSSCIDKISSEGKRITLKTIELSAHNSTIKAYRLDQSVFEVNTTSSKLTAQNCFNNILPSAKH